MDLESVLLYILFDFYIRLFFRASIHSCQVYVHVFSNGSMKAKSDEYRDQIEHTTGISQHSYSQNNAGWEEC